MSPTERAAHARAVMRLTNLSFMRSPDTPEIHGYRLECGDRVYVDQALEIVATARPAPTQDPPDRPAIPDPAYRDEAPPAQRKVNDVSV